MYDTLKRTCHEESYSPGISLFLRFLEAAFRPEITKKPDSFHEVLQIYMKYASSNKQIWICDSIMSCYLSFIHSLWCHHDLSGHVYPDGWMDGLWSKILLFQWKAFLWNTKNCIFVSSGKNLWKKMWNLKWVVFICQVVVGCLLWR